MRGPVRRTELEHVTSDVDVHAETVHLRENSGGRPTVGRIPGLDGMRALGVLMVVVGHASNLPQFPAALRHLLVFDIAHLGVNIFFVLSGFLITTLLIDERARTGRVSLRDFYIRRTVRIFPAAFLYIGVVALLVLAGWRVLAPGDLVHALTYTMNFHHERAWSLGHLWSLSVEEQFYLLWPGLFLLARQRALPLLLALMVLAPLARVVVWILFPGERVGIDEEFPFVADALAAGCVVALLCERVGGERLAAWMPGWGYALAAGTTLLAASFSEWPSFHLPIGASLVNVGIAVVLLGIVHRPFVLLKRWLDSAPLIYIGGLSYSLYLWQQLFLDPDQPLANRSLLLAIGLAFLAAVASHRLVERPLLALRAHLRH